MIGLLGRELSLIKSVYGIPRSSFICFHMKYLISLFSDLFFLFQQILFHMLSFEIFNIMFSGNFVNFKCYHCLCFWIQDLYNKVTFFLYIIPHSYFFTTFWTIFFQTKKKSGPTTLVHVLCFLPYSHDL